MDEKYKKSSNKNGIISENITDKADKHFSIRKVDKSDKCSSY